MTLPLDKLPRRLVVALAVLALNAAAYAFGVGALVDTRDDAGRDVSAARQKAAATQQRTRQLRQEIDELRKLQPEYERIAATGFTRPQDRLAALRQIEMLQARHPVQDATFNMATEAAAQISVGGRPHALVATPIELRAAALLDRDIIDFWSGVLAELPGRARPSRLHLARTAELTPELRARLLRGERPNLVSGTLALEWLTTKPETPQSGQAVPR